MRSTILACALCTIALVACSSEDGGDNTGTDSKTLELRANNDGSLGYCDDAGNCTSLPNPGDCSVLTVTIDTASGKTCQVCTSAGGVRSDENCTTPAVACDVVTIPEPDCVVCAYVNGTVLFSTCQPSDPICYTTNGDGSVSSSGPGTATEAAPPEDASGRPIAPPPGCTVCVDASGKRISQDCPPSCLDVPCADIVCAPGYRYVTAPGDCCGSCEPVSDCSGVACPAIAPYCPDGQWLVKDPTDCCGWYCEARDCGDTIACTDVMILCADGYELSYAAPHCCGACVPADPTQ